MPTTDLPLPTPPRWPLIARALFARSDPAGALIAWRKAAIEAPGDATAWAAVSLLLANVGNAAAAVLPARVAAALRPDAADDHARLGAVLALTGVSAGSARAFRRALALAPGNGLVHARTGHIVGGAARPDLAFRHLARAVAIDPTDGVSWLAVGRYFLADFAFDRAELSLKRGLVAAPAEPDLLAQMGQFRRDQGEAGASLRFYDRSLAARSSAKVERASLLALLYAPDVFDDEHFGRHLAYARRHAPERPRPPAEPLAGRRIRVGYLSSGFFDHPTAALTVGLIEAHDHTRFEIHLFAHVRAPDAMSRRLEAAADHWISVHGLSHEAIAERIRAAGIDILVHPAGRHDEVTWSVAALRPASIQVALYEEATTGIAAFDYLVTDAVLTPRNSTERLVERPLRLPSLPLHELPAEAPAVAPLPALTAGHVTFGSLNNSAKLNDGVLALWARTLAAVPGSRMIIKAHALAGRRLARRVRDAFAGAGVGEDRVDLVTSFTSSRRSLLEVYDGIDIGLDALPWPGVMTSFEAMCQGVPIVTLTGPHMLARWGATLAIHAGHPELVAETPEAFVSVARRLAADLPALARLRARLRDDFLSSPLCDGRLKARHFERAFRFMMRQP